MALSKKYLKSRHSVHMLHAHLVFCIKYRRKVISLRVRKLIIRSMAATAKALKAKIKNIETDKDHLHIMILYPPNLCLSKITQRLKGASSRSIRKHNLPEVTSKLWGASFWSPSYFVESCGGVTLEIIAKYIDNQQTKVKNTRPTRPKSYPRTKLRGFSTTS